MFFSWYGAMVEEGRQEGCMADPDTVLLVLWRGRVCVCVREREREEGREGGQTWRPGSSEMISDTTNMASASGSKLRV